MGISRITDICKQKGKIGMSGSLIDKHTKRGVGSEVEVRSRVGNLWLMIGHGIRQKVKGSLVRSGACVGERGCERRCIYTVYRPIDF